MALKHVGIIMDGNRRFAKRLMAQPWKGHEWGQKKLEEVLHWCEELQIPMLTVYAFSMQNFNRPEKEFNYLVKLFNEGIDELLGKVETELKEKQMRIRFIGRYKKFPSPLPEKMEELMEHTKNNSKFTLNVAVAYGGRAEIIDSVRQLVVDGISADEITEEAIAENLYMQDEPDLIIRTGGDHRTSNFLIWQSYYSEWFFVQKLWPEFEKEDFFEVVEQFNNRERRFGK